MLAHALPIPVQQNLHGAHILALCKRTASAHIAADYHVVHEHVHAVTTVLRDLIMHTIRGMAFVHLSIQQAAEQKRARTEKKAEKKKKLADEKKAKEAVKKKEDERKKENARTVSVQGKDWSYEVICDTLNVCAVVALCAT